MKEKRVFVLLSLFYLFAFLSACSSKNTNPSSADWAYAFVVWNEHIYMISDEYVQQVDEEIGEVTAYSDMEGTYSGNFSNEYTKGTKYYSIPGVSTKETIAIKEESGSFRKGIGVGKYEGK